jgi:hypothetical protein
VDEVEVLAERLRIVLERRVARADQRDHVSIQLVAYFFFQI